MSVLDDVLKEEYDRQNNLILKITEEVKELPKGYISEKKISGNVYYYLQKREGSKVSSKYIEQSEVESYRILIKRRKELEQKKKELLAEQKKIEKVIGDGR